MPRQSQTLTKQKVDISTSFLVGVAVVCATVLIGSFGMSAAMPFLKMEAKDSAYVYINQDPSVTGGVLAPGVSDATVVGFVVSTNNKAMVRNDANVNINMINIRTDIKDMPDGDLTKLVFTLRDEDGGSLADAYLQKATNVKKDKYFISFDNLNLDFVINDVPRKYIVTVSISPSLSEAMNFNLNFNPWRFAFGHVLRSNKLGNIRGVVTRGVNMDIPAAVEPLGVSMVDSDKVNNIARGVSVPVATMAFFTDHAADDIYVSEIQSMVHTIAMSPDELWNPKLYYNGVEISLSQPADLVNFTPGGDELVVWKLANPMKLTKGMRHDIVVKAMVSGSTSSGDWFAFDFNKPDGPVDIKATMGGEPITPVFDRGPGQQNIVSTSGTLVMTRSDQISNGYITGNSDGLVIGKFRASATNGSVDIEKIVLDVGSYQNGGTDELNAIYLYDNDNNQVAEAVIHSSNMPTVEFNMQNSPITVPEGNSEEFTIKVDTGLIGDPDAPTNSRATEGFEFRLNTEKVVAKTIGVPAIIMPGNIFFATQAVVKSIPLVIVASSGDMLYSDSEYDLIEVTVAADTKGPVGLYKMSFKIDYDGVIVSNFKVYEGGTLVSNDYPDDGRIGMKAYHVGSGSYAYQMAEVYFNLGGSSNTVRQISAGTAKTYTLKANVTDFDLGDGVSISILGDSSPALKDGSYYLTASDADSLNDSDFIWSDLSYGGVDSDSMNYAQWMNGSMLDSLGGFLPYASNPVGI